VKENEVERERERKIKRERVREGKTERLAFKSLHKFTKL
jgi:hypothetical protein